MTATSVTPEPPLEVSLALPAEDGLALALDTVEEWGGEFEEPAESHPRGPVKLQLPVRAGLRYGFVEGQLGTRDSDPGSRLVLHVTASHYRLHISAMMVLLLGAIGGLSMLFMPLFPALLDLLPLAGLLVLLAWFLVASQVKHRSARDLLEEVAARADQLEAASEPAE